MRVFKREWAKTLPVFSCKAGKRTWYLKHRRTGNDPCFRRRELLPPYVTPSRLAGATIKFDLKSTQVRYNTTSISYTLAA